MQYLNYAQGMNANKEVISWVETTLQAYLKSNPRVTQVEVEHLLDFACSDSGPKKMIRMSYEQLKSLAEKWNKALQKKGAGIKESQGDIKIIHEFSDGLKIVQLIGQPAFKREGFLMRHCVADFYGKADRKIYSLRDKNNNPHVTFDVSMDGKNITQLKGKGNGSVHPKYIDAVLVFLEKMGIDVRESEMKNLGYYALDKELENLMFEVCGNIAKKKIGNTEYAFAG